MSAVLVEKVRLELGGQLALSDLSLEVAAGELLPVLGPSGCGKTSLLRVIAGLEAPQAGRVRIGEQWVNDPAPRVPAHRRGVGMVFQQPNPFPMSIYDNVAFGPRLHGVTKKAELDEIVEKALVRANLWKEVKDIMGRGGLTLSGGQQQRLCIARVLAVQPDVLLMDEPCSAIDPTSVQKVEDLMAELKSTVTIIIVTHNMQQAARVADETAFFLQERQGEPAELIEFGRTAEIFTSPHDRRTEDYITGRFG